MFYYYAYQVILKFSEDRMREVIFARFWFDFFLVFLPQVRPRDVIYTIKGIDLVRFIGNRFSNFMCQTNNRLEESEISCLKTS